MTDAPDDTKPTTFIYIGRGTTSDGKLGAKIIALDLLRKCTARLQAEQLSSFFTMKERELPRSIGFTHTIKAKCDDTGRIVLIRGNHTPSYEQVRHTGDIAEWVAHWQAIDTAEKIAVRARKALAKYDRDELKQRLKPLKHDWQTTDRIGRLALEVVILDILRSE